MRIARAFLLAGIAALLGSCSIPHPLQDDVTRLPLSAIIRKITCEAKDALDDFLEKKGVSWKRQEFKDTNDKLKKLTKRILKPRQDETKQLKKMKQDLDFAIAANTGELNAASAAAATAPPDAEATPEAKARRERLLKERAKILENVVVYTRAVGKHNRDVDIAQKAIDAATKTAKKLQKGLSPYYNHQMAYSFRFRIIETDVVAGAAAWKLPAFFNGNVGSWTIGGAIGDTKERESERNVKLLISFEDLHGTDCSDAPPQAGRLRAVHYPIRGKIGVDEVIREYFALLDRAKRDQGQDAEKQQDDDDDDGGKTKKIFAKTDAYTDSILFTTTITGSVSPSIILNPALREQFTASLGVSGTRKDFHTVLISLSAPDSDDSDRDSDKIQRVQIISDDGLSVR